MSIPIKYHLSHLLLAVSTLTMTACGKNPPAIMESNTSTGVLTANGTDVRWLAAWISSDELILIVTDKSGGELHQSNENGFLYHYQNLEQPAEWGDLILHISDDINTYKLRDFEHKSLIIDGRIDSKSVAEICEAAMWRINGDEPTEPSPVSP